MIYQLNYFVVEIYNNNYTSSFNGEMAEWLKAPVLKTGKGATLSWVRIPVSPPLQSKFSKFINYVQHKRIIYIRNRFFIFNFN